MWGKKGKRAWIFELIIPLQKRKKKFNREPKKTKFSLPKKTREKSEVTKREKESEKCLFFKRNKGRKMVAESECQFPNTGRGKKAPSTFLPLRIRTRHRKSSGTENIVVTGNRVLVNGKWAGGEKRLGMQIPNKRKHWKHGTRQKKQKKGLPLVTRQLWVPILFSIAPRHPHFHRMHCMQYGPRTVPVSSALSLECTRSSMHGDFCMDHSMAPSASSCPCVPS